MRAASAFLLALILPVMGCIPPITPMERLQQSAHEVAAALRFSRTDIAAEYVATQAREAFLARHMVWSESTRVLDLELLGIYLRTSDEAESFLRVSWQREDGAIMHTTEISQKWKRETGSFRMVDEVYHRGDKGLFDMLPKKEEPKKAGDKAAAAGKDEPTAAPAATSDRGERSPDARERLPDVARVETRVIRD